MFARLFYYLEWVAIGGLLGASFLHPWLWWLALVGLVIALIRAEKAATTQHAFWGGAVAGTVKVLFVLNWLWSMGFGDLLQMSSYFALMFAIGFVWIGCSLSMGMPFGLFTLSVLKLRNSKLRFLYLPLVLVGVEVIGSLAFGLFTLGDTSSFLSFDFSFGYLGYTLAHHYWLGLFAVAGGVYALTVLIALLALALVILFRNAEIRSRFTQASCLLFVVVCLAVGAFEPKSVPGETKVAAIYTFYTANNEASKRARVEQQDAIRDAAKAALQAGAGYVVMPETVSVFSDPSDTERNLAFIRENARGPAVLVDSFVDNEQSSAANVAAAVYDTGRNEVHIVHKQYLLPYGEYFPYHMKLLFSVAGITTEEVLDGRVVYDGGSKDPIDTPSDLPRVLFCSENISPYLAFFRSRNSDTPFIAHMVSHGWFQDPDTLWNQLDMMLKTNARFSGLPIIEAGNSTPPRAFDSMGRALEPEVIHSAGGVVAVMYGI